MFAELHKKRRRSRPAVAERSRDLGGIMRDLYITRTSEVSGVAREVLERELSGKAGQVHRRRQEMRQGYPPSRACGVARNDPRISSVAHRLSAS